MNQEQLYKNLKGETGYFFSDRKDFREGWSFEDNLLRLLKASFPDFTIDYECQKYFSDDVEVIEKDVLTLKKGGVIIEQIDGVWGSFFDKTDAIFKFIDQTCKKLNIKRKWFYASSNNDYEFLPLIFAEEKVIKALKKQEIITYYKAMHQEYAHSVQKPDNILFDINTDNNSLEDLPF